MWKAAVLVVALAAARVLGEEAYCSDSCEFGLFGQCDDGGEGSATASCPLGTDCRDCGVRSVLISTAGEEETTFKPTTATPTSKPTTFKPTKRPSLAPTLKPTKRPTFKPTKRPTKLPTFRPTKRPTSKPTKRPTTPRPTKRPSEAPTRKRPTGQPTKRPTTPKPSSVAPTKRPSSLQPTSVEQRNWCTDQCSTANNGRCEDGGTLAVAGSCELGTDCGDCGSRDPLVVLPADDTDSPTTAADYANCNDLCASANNGQCEDGLETAASSQCDPGADCTDCGPRDVYTQAPSTVPPSASPSVLPTTSPSTSPQARAKTTKAPSRPLTAKPTVKGATLAPDVWNCNNLCLWAEDGVCDDGGLGSAHNVCIPGSDCKDCGPRDRTARPTR